MALDLEKQLVARATELRQPLTANFELTPCCNMQCDMCFIRHTPRQVETGGGLRDAASWTGIARQLMQLDTLFILLTGGEPMLHPEFDAIYRTLRSMGFIITLNTNGTLITEEMCRTTFREKPRRVNVTLYGSNAGTYQRLCHYGEGFEHTMRGLRLLKEYGIDTKLNFSMVRANAEEFDEMIALAQELDIPVTSCSYMFSVNRGGNNANNVIAARLTPEDAARLNICYLKYKEGDDFESFAKHRVLQAADESPKGYGLNCRAGSSAMWVSWNHRVTPCVMMGTPCVDLATGRTYSFDITGTVPAIPNPAATAAEEAPPDMKPYDMAAAWSWLTQTCRELPEIDDCAGCRLKQICQVCYAAAIHEKRQCGTVDYLCDMAKNELSFLKSHAKDSIIHQEGHRG